MHRVRDITGGGFRIWLEFEYRRIFCYRCKAVKRETLTWLATGALFTKRAENNIGRQCRTQTIKQVAEFNHIGWAQAQRMAIVYMKRVVEANLDEKGRRSLELLLKANKRLYKAYLLKESFGQLRDYRYPASPASSSRTGRPNYVGRNLGLMRNSPP